MNGADGYKEKNREGRRRIFLPNARVLSQAEIETLPGKERKFATESKDGGLWVEILWPDEASRGGEEERVKLPVFCEDPKHEHSLWLDIFCPGGSCQADDPTKAT